jgi:hypothetical protein
MGACVRICAAPPRLKTRLSQRQPSKPMIGRTYHAIGSTAVHDDREAIRPCSCGKPRTKSFHLACPECWALVPQALQTKVYRLFKREPGSDAHRAAVRDCYEHIRRGRELTAGAAAVDDVKPAAPAEGARIYKPGDRVQWMHENTSGSHIKLTQRTGTVKEVHRDAAIVRDDSSGRKFKITMRRLRSIEEKGQVMEVFEAVVNIATQLAPQSKSSPSPES